jgi:transcriptional regulator with XRE-family HTH domain
MPQVRTVTPDGERIRELRLGLGLSADMVGIACATPRHGSTIRRLERGEHASEIVVAQVARVLQVRLSDITLQRKPVGCAAGAA